MIGREEEEREDTLEREGILEREDSREREGILETEIERESQVTGREETVTEGEKEPLQRLRVYLTI